MPAPLGGSAPLGAPGAAEPELVGAADPVGAPGAGIPRDEGATIPGVAVGAVTAGADVPKKIFFQYSIG